MSGVEVRSSQGGAPGNAVLPGVVLALVSAEGVDIQFTEVHSTQVESTGQVHCALARPCWPIVTV